MTKNRRKIKITAFFLGILFLSFPFLSGCQGSKDLEIARVGDSVLYESTLQKMIPQNAYHLMSREQLLHWVRNWIDEQVLSQKATQEGIDQRPSVAALLAKSRRDILAQILLDEKLGKVPEPSDELLQQFLQSQQSNFLYQDTIYQYVVVQAPTAKSAWNLFKEVKKRSFQKVVKHLPRGYKVLHNDSSDVYSQDVIPCEKKVLQKLKVGGTSAPFICKTKALLIHLSSKNMPGDQKKLSAIRSELVYAWKQNQLEERKRKLLKEIKMNLPIITFPENIRIDNENTRSF